MKKIPLLLLTLAAYISTANATPTYLTQSLYNWVVYYNNRAAHSEFNAFNPIVFDADFHPDLASFRDEDKTVVDDNDKTTDDSTEEPTHDDSATDDTADQDSPDDDTTSADEYIPDEETFFAHVPTTLEESKKILGYVSLGEVGNYRYYFQDVQSAGILLSQNPNYPGSWYIDIRSSAWTDLVLNTIIPNVLAQGFQGIFMDALDIPIYLEQINPAAYAGMTQAAINLISAIRNAYPDAPLMLNRAYPILNNVGGYINYALGESVYTSYNFSTQQYQLVDQARYVWSLGYLQGAQALFPDLIVMSLDYWDPADTTTYREIYKTERDNGFHPYVSTINLNQITPEP